MSNFNTRIKSKRDTAANWTANNPVLLNGEIILIDTDSGELRAKVGDGVKTYTQLPFTDEILRNLITGKQNKLTGTSGQYVGFDSSGNAVAVDPPSSLPSGGSKGKLLGYGTEPEWVDSPVLNVVITVHNSGNITCDHTLEEIEKTYMDGGEISAWIVESSFPAEASMYMFGGMVQFAICFPLESPSAQRYFTFDFAASGYGVVSGQQLGTGGSWGEEHWVYTIPDREKITAKNKTIPTSAWSANSTYADLGFNYRASVSVSNVTTSYIPDVNFSPADQYSGNLASFADTYNGGVYIYAKTQPTDTVTIASAIFTRS